MSIMGFLRLLVGKSEVRPEEVKDLKQDLMRLDSKGRYLTIISYDRGTWKGWVGYGRPEDHYTEAEMVLLNKARRLASSSEREQREVDERANRLKDDFDSIIRNS